MTIRRAVQELLDAGPLPSEEASEEEIASAQHLLEQIAKPVSGEEAQALTAAFGSDDCYGLSWTLLHLIETAPSAHNANYSQNTDNPWVELLNSRVEFGKENRGV
ncbi:hypothetical protein [Streptomyces spirodelae]|uniref:Uncharacterized protein n=1 Tax=Streptomyces spirodelae TaxID=2812904 RepID=A0ABS3WNT5_9ACTN|nr:hypothetical protein [Streptomyces spirodelae]MBO8184785.1 hypothetical protein [Streptomyces spirodelae]